MHKLSLNHTGCNRIRDLRRNPGDPQLHFPPLGQPSPRQPKLSAHLQGLYLFSLGTAFAQTASTIYLPTRFVPLFSWNSLHPDSLHYFLTYRVCSCLLLWQLSPRQPQLSSHLQGLYLSSLGTPFTQTASTISSLKGFVPLFSSDSLQPNSLNY